METKERQEKPLRNACSELVIWFPSWMYMIGSLCWANLVLLVGLFHGLVGKISVVRECACPCLIVASVDSHPQLLNFLSSYDFIHYVTICEARFNLRHFPCFCLSGLSQIVTPSVSPHPISPQDQSSAQAHRASQKTLGPLRNPRVSQAMCRCGSENGWLFISLWCFTMFYPYLAGMILIWEKKGGMARICQLQKSAGSALVSGSKNHWSWSMNRVCTT